MCKDDVSYKDICYRLLEINKSLLKTFIVIIISLIIGIIAVNIYWINRFLSFNYETVVIDGTDGSTNAYIDGDNNIINNKEQ